MSHRGGVFEDVKDFKKRGGLTSLFGINRDYEDYEDEEEILDVKRPLVGDREKLIVHKKKGDYNLPELMKYSDYDRKAWNFFRRYRDEFDY